MISWVKEVLEFWFGTDPAQPLKNQNLWWKKDPQFDEEIRTRFQPLLEKTMEQNSDDFLKDPQTCLAYIILMDQFSRNIYRDHPESFAQDLLALQASLKGQDQGFDRKLDFAQRWFFYMPMMHAEDRNVQQKSLAAFRQLIEEAPENKNDVMQGAYDYALLHAQIVERFGRFPHRNAILGRKSTPEEIEFLKQPNSSF